MTKIKDYNSRSMLKSLTDIENPSESKSLIYYCIHFMNKIIFNNKLFSDVKQAVPFFTFYLLHSMFVPTSKKVTIDDRGKKNIIKFSIKDSQNTFMVFCSTVTMVEEYITNCNQLKLPIHPFIIIIGTPLEPREIIVYFDSIKFKVFTVIRAIDLCFKIFQLFNLKYPIQSGAVWHFIQKYLYSIKTKFDKSYPNLNQIIYDLENNV